MRTLIAAVLLVSASMAQTFIPLNGQVYDGNGGPLLSGQVYHIIGSGGSCGMGVPTGQTLTIQPGAIIKIDGCVGITGVVNALGTQNSPIVFTSIHDDTVGGDTNGNGNATFPAPGDWNEIDCGGPGSRFEWCNWSYGGGLNRSVMGLRLSPHVFEDCRFEDHLQDGLSAAARARITRCHFEDIGGIPVRDLHLPVLQYFFDNTAFNCGGGEYVRMIGAQNFAGNLVMDHRLSFNGNGIFVFDASNLSPQVPAGTFLTVPAGTVIKFASGFLTSFGQLNCQGTAASPVVLTSLFDDAFGGDTQKDGSATTPAPGDWTGVQLENGDTSTIRNTIVRYAGVGASGRGIYASGSSATIANSVVEFTNGDGVSIRNLGSPPMEITDCVFRDNSKLPIRDIHWAELEKCASNTASNNGAGDHYRIQPERPNTPIDIAPDSFPGDVLEVANGTLINPGGSLTLPAGTILKFPSRAASGFTLSSSSAHLYLRGTARRPIVLTSFKDDTWGGDTNGDGATTSPAPNDIGRIVFGLNAGASVLQNVIVRYGTNTTIESGSASVALRNVRVEFSNAAGLRLSRVQEVVNLVAYGCLGNGIELHNGSYDLVHATAASNALGGIVRTSLWSGQVVNSNAWGNGGLNIDVPPAQVADSNGVGPANAGSNGNIDADPLFVDAANGDLSLQSGSPCLGAADRATALAVGSDHDEFPRVLDDGLSGAWQADQGAYERNAYSMTVAGDAVLGGTLTFGIQGPPGIGGFFLGAGGPPIPVPGLGVALTGPANTIGAFVPVGGSIQLNVPNDPGLVGGGFAVQGAGLRLVGSTLRGGLTNVERGIVRP